MPREETDCGISDHQLLATSRQRVCILGRPSTIFAGTRQLSPKRVFKSHNRFKIRVARVMSH